MFIIFVLGVLAYVLGAFRPIHEVGHVIFADGYAHVAGWGTAYIQNPTPKSIMGGYGFEMSFWLTMFFLV